jgi:hypothetical protein
MKNKIQKFVNYLKYKFVKKVKFDNDCKYFTIDKNKYVDNKLHIYFRGFKPDERMIKHISLFEGTYLVRRNDFDKYQIDVSFSKLYSEKEMIEYISENLIRSNFIKIYS